MADTTEKAMAPMTDSDLAPATKRGDAAVDAAAGRLEEAKQTIVEKTTDLREQAADKARLFAEDGKAKATEALGQLSQMLADAAGQIDEKLGDQYGRYARDAAARVDGLSASLSETSLDDIAERAREFVRKSPGVAVGAAAAVGFVVARLLTAGLDQRDPK